MSEGVWGDVAEESGTEKEEDKVGEEKADMD
jgi:hypothetical protein